jgi:hypothetical protein
MWPGTTASTGFARQVTSETGEVTNGNDITDHLDLAVAGCSANLAVQLGLGILSERRLGIGRPHSCDPGIDGPNLMLF